MIVITIFYLKKTSYRTKIKKKRLFPYLQIAAIIVKFSVHYIICSIIEIGSSSNEQTI
jgi:hypothetical protein